MFNKKTVKEMTDVEYVTEIYMMLLRIPTEYIEDFFQGVDQVVKKELSQEGYLFFETIKSFVISNRMEKAIN